MLKRQSLVRIAPFATWMALMVAEDAVDLLDGLVSADLANALRPGWYPLRTVATGLVLALFWRRFTEFASSPKGTGASTSARAWAESVAVGLFAWVIWVVTGPWLTQSAPEAGSPLPESPAGAAAWLFFRLLGSIVIVPLMEELFWRSYLMRRLDRRDFLALSPDRISWFAMIASSAVFAAAHRELLAGFLCGLIFAAFYRRRLTLQHVVAAHAVTNLMLAVQVLASGRWQIW